MIFRNRLPIAIANIILTFFLVSISIKCVQSSSQNHFSIWGASSPEDYSNEEETETPITIILPMKPQPAISSSRSRPRTTGTGRSDFGETCDEFTARCSPNSQLSCTDGTCQCSKPDDMVYDPATSKCFVRSGEQCKYEITVIIEPERVPETRRKVPSAYDPLDFSGFSPFHISSEDEDEYQDDPSTGYPKTRQQNRYEVLPCVSNAKCINSICKCNLNFFEDADGQCSKRKEFGSFCTANSECKEQPGLVCTEGRCGCNPLIAKANSRNRCIGLPGQPCIRQQCADNTVCSKNVCTCTGSFRFDDVERKCKAKHGSACKNSGECVGSLVCLNNVCECSYQKHQLFEESESKCRSIVSAPCAHDQDCVPHATCQQDSNGFQESTCQCADGFIESGPGFCYGTNGKSCSSTNVSSTSPAYKVPAESFLAGILNSAPNDDSRYVTVKLDDSSCAADRNLNCLNSTCSCEERMETFDESLGSCVGLAGALCRLDSENYCVENSTCISTSRSKKANLFGKCSCSDGFSVDTERHCTE